MSNKVSDNKLLASLAVFRSLDKEGKTINEILSEFLIDIIKSQYLHQFTAGEVSSLLDEMYDFQIPDAVIRTALKKIDFVSVSHHQYTVSDVNKLKEYNLEEKQSEMLQEYNNILEALYFYIEDKQQLSLSSDDRKKIEKAFTGFVLDNATDNGFSDYISAFIIDNKSDQYFMDNLETIKEGVILYTGLKFNPNINLNTSWKENFTIYLNTEIIFHLSGYNGELYRVLFNDFHNLVKDVNRKHKYIRLKYFKETKTEIDSFFYAAEKIISGKNALNASSPAMRMLVNGSKDSIDIFTKKAQLFELLKTYGINEEENEDIYERENYKYNISEKTVIEKYTGEFDERYSPEYIQDIIKKLNYISIKRAEREKNNFEHIGYILLTENSKINMIAWDEEIKNRGDVPLATNLQFMTNKLWFKLNKGFGTGDYPTSFKVVTKAQTLLSSHLSDKLGKEYKELKNRVKNGEMTESVALTVLYELRNRSKMPEELFDSDMTSVLATITEKKLDDYALQYENTIKKAKEEEMKNSKLEKAIESISTEKTKILTDKEKTIKEKEEVERILQQTKEEKKEEKDSFNQMLLKEKEKNHNQLIERKKTLDDEAGRQYSHFKYKIGSAFFAYYILIFICMYKFGWDVMEQWIWIVTFALPILASVIYSFIKEKPFKIDELLKAKKSNILESVYKKNKFNINEIGILSEEIEELKSELNK